MSLRPKYRSTHDKRPMAVLQITHVVDREDLKEIVCHIICFDFMKAGEFDGAFTNYTVDTEGVAKISRQKVETELRRVLFEKGLINHGTWEDCYPSCTYSGVGDAADEYLNLVFPDYTKKEAKNA